ncbi:MAG TPA: phosphate ABC transporter permease PstA [Woeseiaceae bacterium]|nr:phosphate ABC transporter permease PstA [Woeseiaceae bacterium]
MAKAGSSWWQSGSPWIWLTAGAVTLSMLAVFGLVVLIAVRGLAHFWPADVFAFRYAEAEGRVDTVIASVRGTETVTAARLREAGLEIAADLESVDRHLVKTGNRDRLGHDFRFLLEPRIVEREQPADVVVVERTEWGDQLGFLREVKESGATVATGDEAWPALLARIERVADLRSHIRELERGRVAAINYALEQLRLEQRRYDLDGELTDARRADIERRRTALEADYAGVQAALEALYSDIGRDSYVVEIQDGSTVELPLATVVRAHRPNLMGPIDKLAFWFARLWEFVSDEPREANTEGGVFPAIFGTVVMVLLMSVFVTPFGVIAAVYLREYAKQGLLTRTIRIAVNNLAGVPSIVYGVFGLGFFVYFLGGSLDALFYPEAAPSPVFGTPGLLWSSLTLALLTLPVVIVATEEGLARIPRSILEGSYALGATRAETLWRTVLPMASPAMMTGLILAVARAAGEVAPLMLVGVVKLAPSLPIDGNPPFLHLDRKFMHLGFHIYDVGFQSPNVEAARPLVYATALLLVLTILVLNLAAVHIRKRLREKYRALEG